MLVRVFMTPFVEKANVFRSDSDFVFVFLCMYTFEDRGVRMLGLVGDSSSSLVALVVTDHFSYSHLPTIGSVWSCSVMLGTQDPLERADGAQEQRIIF